MRQPDSLVTWIGSRTSSHIYSGFLLFTVESVRSTSYLFLFLFVVFHSTVHAFVSQTGSYFCLQLTNSTVHDFWNPWGQCRRVLPLLSVLKHNEDYFITMLLSLISALPSSTFYLSCSEEKSVLDMVPFTFYLWPSQLSHNSSLIPQLFSSILPLRGWYMILMDLYTHMICLFSKLGNVLIKSQHSWGLTWRAPHLFTEVYINILNRPKLISCCGVCELRRMTGS